MADGTLQILGVATGAVPRDRQIIGTQTLDLIAVKADFDGTSALVDFVPVVEILSDAGLVMAQSKGPTVTAGDSATVTFAPFLDEPAAASAGGITEIVTTNGSVTVTSPFGPIVGLAAFVPPTGNAHYQATTAAIGAGAFADFSWAHVNGGTPLNLGTPTLPKVTASGHYAFSLLSQGNGIIGAGDELKLTLTLTDPTPTDAPGLIFDYTPGLVVNPVMALTAVAYMKVNGTVKGTIISVVETGTMTHSGDLWVTRLS